jgi:phosphatidylethanolamine/phosphatidyl-N-methylethanolamine N-methyltransferase
MDDSCFDLMTVRPRRHARVTQIGEAARPAREAAMTAVTGDLSGDRVRKAYGRWAAVYDGLCGPVFRPAHRAAARAANAAGKDILEVGVGTGLVLPLYARDARVVGVDLSEEMLARARSRVSRLRLPQVRRLEAGDIHTLDHGGGRYDAVVFPFVLTLVENPERALDNSYRMLRSGGEIVIVSHLRSENGAVAAFETLAAPLIARVGLRPDFPLARIAAWATVAGADIAGVERVGLLGVYTLVRLRRP